MRLLLLFSAFLTALAGAIGVERAAASPVAQSSTRLPGAIATTRPAARKLSVAFVARAVRSPPLRLATAQPAPRASIPAYLTRLRI